MRPHKAMSGVLTNLPMTSANLPKSPLPLTATPIDGGSRQEEEDVKSVLILQADTALFEDFPDGFEVFFFGLVAITAGRFRNLLNQSYAQPAVFLQCRCEFRAASDASFEALAGKRG